jgi:hypothetical protein
MRFSRDLLLTALTSAVVLLLLEGGLRLASVHYEGSFYENERERGYRLRPNSEGWSVVEKEVYLHINSEGMRDRERPAARPARTLRVAVVGSSEADASQVPFDRTFESVLNRDLSAWLRPAGRRADVLNFGVPGYTFSQEYLTLRNHVWKYDPQVVVLLFSAFPVLKTTRDLLPGELKGAPVYVFRGNELVPDAATLAAPPINQIRLRWKNRLSDWMNRSALLSLGNSARRHDGSLVAGMIPAEPKANSVWARTERWAYDSEDPDIQQQWRIAEEFLRMMKRECDRHGAEFWIAVADKEMQTDPGLAERAAYQRRMRLSSLDLVERRLERLGAASGIPVISLCVPLGAYAAAHNVFLHGPLGSPNHIGHWNEIGHEQVGHAIARNLIESSHAVRAVAP